MNDDTAFVVGQLRESQEAIFDALDPVRADLRARGLSEFARYVELDSLRSIMHFLLEDALAVDPNRALLWRRETIAQLEADGG